MTVRFVKSPDPRQLPEFTLWRMAKDGRAAECRTRIVPLGDGVPEIRILVTRSDGEFELLWSEVLKDGRDVNERSARRSSTTSIATMNGWWRVRDIVEQQKIAAWATVDLAAKNREARECEAERIRSPRLDGGPQRIVPGAGSTDLLIRRVAENACTGEQPCRFTLQNLNCSMTTRRASATRW